VIIFKAEKYMRLFSQKMLMMMMFKEVKKYWEILNISHLHFLSCSGISAAFQALLGVVALAQVRTPLCLVFALRELVGRGAASPY
jgi:hypothetical protein